MNAKPGPLSPAKPLVAKPLARSSLDREFLPAALEILDSPASPIRSTFIWVICAIFAISLAWSWYAKLDIHAVASGRIQLSGRSKIVQPLEPGRVQAILVENGSRVRPGDILVELDPTETGADLEAQARDVEVFRAEAIRRRTAIEAMTADGDAAPAITFPVNTSATVREREARAMKADLAHFRTTYESLRAQLSEKIATKDRLAASNASREKLIEILKERVAMREQLVSKAAGTRAAVLDSLQQLRAEEMHLAFDKGQAVEAGAAIQSLQRRIEQYSAQSVAEQSDKLVEAERKLDRAEQSYVKAAAKAARTRLTAPIAGSVQQLAVTTIGQVVTSGQPLLVIVPDEGPLEIEALVLNRDVGFIEVGQNAVIKVESFPFTRYGTLEGKVIRVSRDAIDERTASGSADSVSVAQGQNVTPITGTPRTQNLVFPVTIQLTRRTIFVDGKEITLTPGMTVSVEILTGERRVIDYLLAPLREIGSTAARER